MTRTLIAPLHGLRGLAALSVVFAHSNAWWGDWFSEPAGSLGVALFFALSGFLMGHLYLPRAATPHAIYNYAVARFARVYPLFAAVVVISGLATYFSNSWPFQLTTSDVLVHLLGAGDGRTIWTISTELQFYVAFIGIWAVYSVGGGDRDALLVTALLAAIAILWAIGFSTDRIALTGYFHVFAFGLIAAALHRHGRASPIVRRIADWAFPLLFLGWVVAAIVAPNHWEGGRFSYHQVWLMAMIGALVLAAALSSPTGIFGPVMTSRLAMWLGEISFGVYLLHRPVMWALQKSIPGVLGWWWPFKSLLLLSTVLGVAHLVYRHFERPARERIRSLRLRQHALA